MQISSSYSMSGVPYDIKHRNGNVPQFNAEQAVKESENTNRYRRWFMNARKYNFQIDKCDFYGIVDNRNISKSSWWKSEIGILFEMNF